MNTKTIVQKYLDFHKSYGCKITSDFGVLPPPNDTSTLYVSSGMQPLKPYYVGQWPVPKNDFCGLQTCVRTGDIESIGQTKRHLSSFGMLGHFGFDLTDYEKPISMSIRLLTEVYQLPIERLHVTYYGGDLVDKDLETKRIWEKFLPEERIWEGFDDNFWRMSETGPCGVCTEIYYELSSPCSPKCGPTSCNCGRFLELYNLVMTQYNQTPTGLVSLEKKHLDTGMGLERLGMILQGKDDVYQVDCFQKEHSYLQEVGLTGKTVSEKILIDHLHTISILLDSRIIPGNKGREYLLRRLIRRVLIISDELEIRGVGERWGFLQEEEHYKKVLSRGEKLIKKYDTWSPKIETFLHETHGIPVQISRMLYKKHQR